MSDSFNYEIESSSNPLYGMYDLSFIEILTINELVKIANSPASEKISILRHDIYKNINDLVKSHRKLSTSSFYRSIEKLKERGLLASKKSDNVNYRNAIEVYPTSKASQMIGFMMHFIIQFNAQTNIAILDYIEDELLDQLNHQIDLSKISKIRIIDPSVRIDSPADLVSSIIPDAIGMMRILANITIMNSWGASFLVNILSTDQIFSWGGTNKDRADLVIYPLYESNIEYKGRHYLQIIEQLQTLIIDEGYILFIYLNEIKSDHHYVDVLKNFLQLSKFYQTYDSDQLIADLESINLKIVSKFGYKGIKFLLMEW